ncbi:uncharacterized protein MONOS_11028 [Monocercomonoides exilis]|uniref:uncharacterized protein n=1 Tax=Monocercomonoides exilis TaxID=2049356 RepID=UPI00355A1614|nr:hypothetical protein MONOS_11028 [Monocercomonoides exilis]|eukprot:MONOS_11028.1-p1 / transcript=MONOS_11028.1 / gene=MONOS_11028 / organism=Monocercomonoides_exilis_PA203 / gene_product=unspecified product / transcript_product=unspecified product / location=Mono_scaffold00529:32308-32712(+) / protein_length=135 / sequence_SO=supercontig / SO=protein_coding / is_pseudo=false
MESLAKRMTKKNCGLQILRCENEMGRGVFVGVMIPRSARLLAMLMKAMDAVCFGGEKLGKADRRNERGWWVAGCCGVRMKMKRRKGCWMGICIMEQICSTREVEGQLALGSARKEKGNGEHWEGVELAATREGR